MSRLASVDPPPAATSVTTRGSLSPEQLRTGVLLLLVADPDPGAGGEFAESLADHRIETVLCPDGAEALLQIGRLHPDVVLASADLPLVNGATLVQVLRRRANIPVILGIGAADGGEAASALTAGATACVARPYRIREVLPILRAIRPDAIVEAEPPLECGTLRLDPTALEIQVHGQRLHLPPREFRLLQLLMAHANRIVTRDQIREIVWGGGGGDLSNTISVHIRRLRYRLGDDLHDPQIIQTVRGLGYRLVPP
ncbi:MAG: response regulator [Streptosporangiales bacterium]|nr:response regulator [Streptosporangiales bacterium]